MLKLIRNTIRYYLVLCGLFINGLAIEFLIAKAPSIKDIVVPTPAEFIQTFTYGKYITATAMLIMLTFGIIAFAITTFEKKKVEHEEKAENIFEGSMWKKWLFIFPRIFSTRTRASRQMWGCGRFFSTPPYIKLKRGTG